MENGIITRFAIEVAQAERKRPTDMFAVCDTGGTSIKTKNYEKGMMKLVIRAMRQLKMVTNHGNKVHPDFENLIPGLDVKLMREAAFGPGEFHFKNKSVTVEKDGIRGKEIEVVFDWKAYKDDIVKRQPTLEDIRRKVMEYVLEDKEETIDGRTKEGKKAKKEAEVCAVQS